MRGRRGVRGEDTPDALVCKTVFTLVAVANYIAAKRSLAYPGHRQPSRILLPQLPALPSLAYILRLLHPRFL